MASLDLALHPRQLQAYKTDATELLFGGASRGGFWPPGLINWGAISKSDFLRNALVAWCMLIPKLQCKLIRKNSKDILENHVMGERGFKDLCAYLELTKQCRVTQDGVFFSNGSNIIFKHCQDERQTSSAQGNATHVLAIDEATQIGERLIRFFRGWVTMSEEMKARLPDWAKGKFPRIIYTANPIGPSVGYFRRRFIDPRPPFGVELVGAFKQQFIPSKVEDNPSEDPEAAKHRLMEIDPIMGHALVTGDWNSATGDFFHEWDSERHVTPDFTPPEHWFQYRSFDWGGGAPFAVYWWAVSDGEPFRDHLGNERWFPRGARVVYREWYGCNPQEPDKGIYMGNDEIALGILARSDINFKQVPTLTDSKPFQFDGGKGIAKVFEENGVVLTQGDTSRVSGWAVMRMGLKGVPVSGYAKPLPMLYFTESCTWVQDYIPQLPRHPSPSKALEDAAEDGEATHSCDAIRIGCMAHTIIVNRKEPTLTVINKALQKPTMKSLTQAMGQNIF